MPWRQLFLWCVLFLIAGCTPGEPMAADIPLFSGRGTSAGDVAAFEDILREGGWRYSTASTARLDAISEAELKTYGG